MKNTKNLMERGFTIMELMLVIAIIIILIGLVSPAINTVRQKARVQEARAIISSLEVGLSMYLTDVGGYPANLNGLVTSTATGWQGPYIAVKNQYYNTVTSSFIDPWGNPYNYVTPGVRNPSYYDMSTNGPDGIAGNADDVTN